MLRGVAVRDTTPGTQVANCYMLQSDVSASSPNGTIIVAYRHHLNCTSDSCGTYRLMVAQSSDLGFTWQLLSTMITSSVGVWEPMLIWDESRSLVRCFYSREEKPPQVNPRAQQIVQQTSSDWGKTWSDFIVSVSMPEARCGMPGVAKLLPLKYVIVDDDDDDDDDDGDDERGNSGVGDKNSNNNNTNMERSSSFAQTGNGGVWIMVFETTTRWTVFSVYHAQSQDYGATWTNMGPVYAPPAESGHAHCAGAPQVAVSPKTGEVFVSMMTNDDDPVPPPWVQQAFTKVRVCVCVCVCVCFCVLLWGVICGIGVPM